MADLLISVPRETSSEHGIRAWTVAAALREVTSVRIVTENEEWDPKHIWAGIIYNSTGDHQHLARLRATGRPSIYCLALGPLQEGRALDRILDEASHKIATRLKMQAASAVLVDTFAHAQVGQYQYAVTPARIVLPPFPEPVQIGQTERQSFQRPEHLLIVGEYDAALGEAQLDGRGLHDFWHLSSICSRRRRSCKGRQDPSESGQPTPPSLAVVSLERLPP